MERYEILYMYNANIYNARGVNQDVHKEKCMDQEQIKVHLEYN